MSPYRRSYHLLRYGVKIFLGVVIMADEYQVYMHENIVNGKRYIGATKNTWQDRWRSKYRKSRYMSAAVAKYPDECWKHYVLADGLSKQEAAIYEKLYILGYQTNDRRKGYNIGHGGEGVGNVDKLKFAQSKEKYHEHLSEAMKKVWSDKSPLELAEAKKRLRDIWQSSECRAKRKATCEAKRKERENDPKWKESRVVAKERERGRKRERYLKNHIPVSFDLAHFHRSEAAKTVWRNPDYRARMSEALKNSSLKGVPNERVKELWKDEEYRAMMSEKLRQARIGVEHQDSTIVSISSGMKEKWKDPFFRESITSRERKRKTEEQKRAIRASALESGAGRSVYCVETDTTYPSISIAAEELNVKEKRLRDTLSGKQKTTNGYHVFYAEPPKETEKSVECIETGIIYKSIKDASRQTGISNSNIGMVCNGKRKIAGGYHWKYA